MTETAVKANITEAHHLFQRGMAAARSGNKRLAAGLLTRAVRLDPHNEAAWLWLSGVLDDPHQVAFCLNSVLKLNPHNDRALRGLRWLEERNLLNGQPARPASPLPEVGSDKPPAQEQRAAPEPWWIRWRQNHHENNRARIILWSVPLVLICLALLLYETFAFAVEQSRVEPTARPTAAVRLLAVEAPPRSTPVPILDSEPVSLRDQLTAGYLSALDPLRLRLRNAVDSYLNATGRPGGASISQVAAAQALRATVEQVHSEMRSLTPPQDLMSAHELYLKGLELEMQALDNISEFYAGYQVEQANRAARQLQEARALIARARAVFDAQQRHIESSSFLPSFSMR